MHRLIRYLIAERISRSSAPFAMHSVARPSEFAVNKEDPPELNEMLSETDCGKLFAAFLTV
jgi:hypothetical protein